MTNQKTEELREKIADYFAHMNYTTLDKSRGAVGEIIYYKQADQILSSPYLAPYLWDIEEVELPDNPHFHRTDILDYGLGLMNGYDQCLADIHKLGSKLIKAVKLEVKK